MNGHYLLPFLASTFFFLSFFFSFPTMYCPKLVEYFLFRIRNSKDKIVQTLLIKQILNLYH